MTLGKGGGWLHHIVHLYALLYPMHYMLTCRVRADCVSRLIPPVVHLTRGRSEIPISPLEAIGGLHYFSSKAPSLQRYA
jgi:hypothetical protein